MAPSRKGPDARRRRTRNNPGPDMTSEVEVGVRVDEAASIAQDRSE